MEYEEILAIALTFPDVSESTHYRELGAKRKKRAFIGRGHEPGAFAVRLDWATHNRLLTERPDIYFKTPHYDGWPWLLARLDALNREEAQELLEAAWKGAAKPAHLRKRAAW